MDDRTMLELAAKAAGLYAADDISDCWTDTNTGEEGEPLYPPCGFVTLSGVWNPLLDDGDALRLAVKLNMGISIPVMRTPMADVVTFRDSRINVREKGDDILAATRRAITRAAAEIQLAKENGK